MLIHFRDKMEIGKPEMNIGLDRIYAAESRICKIDGENGRLYYRGYPIDVLAERSNFEEVSYLLVYGKLPSIEELSRFRKELREERNLSSGTINMISQMSKRNAHPMHILSATVASIASEDVDINDRSDGAELRRSVKLIAKMASIVATIGRYIGGEEYQAPDPELPHAANFLYMLTGKSPDSFQAKIIDLMFMLQAEHSTNASTFAALVTSSTLADMYMSISSGINALSGVLHGGADEAALKMMKSIGKPENANEYIENALASKQKIMGFGHRVYKAYDPRAKILRKYMEELEGHSNPDSKTLTDIALEIERIMAAKKLGEAKGIWPNIDFFTGPVYTAVGMPGYLFTPVFAASRISGWCAHIIEYRKNNRLIRPLEYYSGEIGIEYMPIEKR